MSQPANEGIQPSNTTIITTTAAPESRTNTPPSAILHPFDPQHPLPDDHHDPLYLVAPQTWAQRNPNSGVQKSRARATLTHAAKASRKVAAARNKANAALLSADVTKQVDLQNAQIEKIAADHNRKACDIEKLINHQMNYRQTRGPSLSNALIHKKGVEMNDGMAYRLCLSFLLKFCLYTDRDAGNKATLAKIREAVDNDPAYRDMEEEDRKEAIDGLIAFRAAKRSNPRVTNKGAARDVFLTMERVEQEVIQQLYRPRLL